MKDFELITILGPTASGKTALACRLASELNTEIISADSRQVYKGMDIGTGKDLNEYIIDEKSIKYHLIDILKAGEKYNIFEFQRDFHNVFRSLKDRKLTPILCGGSGLYIESVLRGYSLVNVPENSILRNELLSKNISELKELLLCYDSFDGNKDIEEKRRIIRAIEIEEYKKTHHLETNDFSPIKSLNIGVNIDRDTRRSRISKRLQNRLKEGMTDEVTDLLKKGVSPEDLIYYGLEYKYITQHVIGEISESEMIEKLEIAIHQFAKRQMTWFRGMEKRGLTIHWLDFSLPMEEKINQIKEWRNK